MTGKWQALDDGVAPYSPPARIAESFRSIAPRLGDTPRPRSPLLLLHGAIERAFVSETGYVLVMGWLADEGCGTIALTIRASGVGQLFSMRTRSAAAVASI